MFNESPVYTFNMKISAEYFMQFLVVHVVKQIIEHFNDRECNSKYHLLFGAKYSI